MPPGNLLGSTSASFTAPPAQALFFRDDAHTNRLEQHHADVAGIRISSVARSPAEIAKVACDLFGHATAPTVALDAPEGAPCTSAEPRRTPRGPCR